MPEEKDVLNVNLKTFLRWLISSPKKPYTVKELVVGAERRGEVPSEVVDRALAAGEKLGVLQLCEYEGIQFWIRK